MKKRVLILPYLFIMLMTFAILFIPIKIVRAEGNVCRNVRINDLNPEEGLYDTLANALKGAQANDTIEFIADYTTPTGGSSAVDKNNITIDFKSYVLTLGTSHTITLFSNATFKGTTGGISNAYNYSSVTYRADVATDYVLTIESGVYNHFDMTVYLGPGSNHKIYGSNYETVRGKINVTGGKFYMRDASTRDHLISLISGCDYLYYETSDCNLDGFGPKVLDVIPTTLITSNNTMGQLKYNYSQEDYYWVKVDSPELVDYDAEYMVGCFDNTHADYQGKYYGYYMKSGRHSSYHFMDAQRCEHTTIDGKLYVDVDDSCLYTIGSENYKYYLTNTNGTRIGTTSGSIYYISTFAVQDYLFQIDYSSGRLKMQHDSTALFLSYRGSGSAASGGNDFGLSGNPISTTSRAFGDSTVNNPLSFNACLYKKVTPDPVVNNAALRFGTTISKDLYDKIVSAGTSVEFGVIAKLTSALGASELEYANAQIKKTITPVRVASANATTEDLEGNYYQFALVLSGITSADFETSVTARCYVLIDGDYYYFNPKVHSVKTMATEYYNAGDTSGYTEFLPSLKVLKEYGD